MESSSQAAAMVGMASKSLSELFSGWQPARFRRMHVPVVDCAYGYQKENQEKAAKGEQNCRQEGDAGEEEGQKQAGQEEDASKKGGGKNECSRQQGKRQKEARRT